MMIQMDIGQEVNLHMNNGEIYHGKVFCFDQENDYVCLEEPHEQSILKQDTRFVKFSAVKSVEVLQSDSKIQSLPHFPSELRAAREKEGLALGKKNFERIGKDVTPEAQLLFNALDKTYKIRWNKKDIEFTELGIVIRPPYQAENCSGKDATALNRIRQVVSTIDGRIRSGVLKH